MFRDKKKKEAAPEIPLGMGQPAPTQAGSPNVEVTKRWKVGDFSISLSNGIVRISACSNYGSAYNSIRLPQRCLASIADALLQAANDHGDNRQNP